MSQTRGTEKRATRKRAKRRNSRSVLMITLVVICFVMAVGALKLSLKRKEASYLMQGKMLQEQIDHEKERSKEIAELEKYMSSDRYVEDVAMKKLGMAYPDDLLLKAR